jgi:hypothetical protein
LKKRWNAEGDEDLKPVIRGQKELHYYSLKASSFDLTALTSLNLPCAFRGHEISF